ncbi:hypothetical protein C463_04019 [Halorubrum californiense DSM 19288]|uniref:DUF998 domain-containing protein n=1 Tax=Halorubrum californiense DSM 19288 TaxID=1227465 RepID=M0EFS9_9EURY|nr:MULTISPECIES: DUF998 domain-containing protein [Halorubrum]ELZ46600.1 hypothetical protein C463_04019 [Halorubrum californiense DSM 19288]TKX68060.1 DUF998 domain-containing protein [Halorubrum sp. GN11GM_10-3_MGM]
MASASTDGRDADAQSDSPESERVTAALGAVATLLALGGIALAILLDPAFSWATDALSDLGVRDGSAAAFNWGLIGGGAAGVGYAAGIGRAGRPLQAVLLALAMVAMAGVGVFDLTEPLHGPAAIGFYLLITVLFAVDGWIRRATATGRVALAFAPVHVTVWATFVAGWWPVTGLALPELPGTLMLAAWVWVVGPAPVVGALRGRAARRDGPTDGH